ncbi:MAG: FAD-dependent oxidoreductase, partial [Pseudomonadota bacterium]
MAARILVIGAGIGGLAAALRLAHGGHSVQVVERHGWPGGKMRQIATEAGPADAGPTVFTMRAVFERLFEAVGTRLEDHVTLTADPLIARHYWPDGASLDLFADPDESARAVRDFAGPSEEAAFRGLCRDAARLFEAFELPVMRSAKPDLVGILKALLRDPGMARLLAPRTLARELARRFHDPRLAQLFGRYATYVGGSPYLSPALLMLIWHAESQGVWRVEGGMHALARAVADLAAQKGAEF